MTPDDFKRNLRGVNDNTDFSPEFLVSCLSHDGLEIYITIASNL